jgi:hypothetical protein
MAKTQWHPLFAALLKALLRDHYEIQTEVPVSELPRKGDFLILRRQAAPAPPFTGLWSYLRDWNLLEFKGMTDAPEEDDLELLFHVGTGLAYKINQERRERREARLEENQMAFWYVARNLGETFLGHARLRTAFVYQTDGVWMGRAWGHPVFLVSGGNLPVQEDSVPLLLMQDRAPRGLADLVVGTPLLLERFAAWLRSLQPEIWKEVRDMAARKGIIDWERVGQVEDLGEILPLIPLERVAQHVAQCEGVQSVIKAAGPEKVIEAMRLLFTPEQLQELLRQETRKAEKPPDAPREG